MKPFIHNDWWDILQPEFEQAYYQELHNFLKQEYRTQTIYPDMNHIFTAFEWTPFQDVKVVILGQDPYHGPHQAFGLSFAVMPGVQVPPSLQNIYKELQDDLGIAPVNHGFLKSWAQQGVLLLNSVLTVRDGRAFSHAGKGWERLTDTAIKRLSERETPVVFILWGRAARDKIKLIDTHTNIVLQSAHPSPLSAYRGFFGSKPFSKTNEALVAMGENPINWQLPASVSMADLKNG
ncbi:uracil-DNA glycosylase [Furfurilactobacillus rossiae]|uniref:Uracil-DNA glycosylase n=1 Tax=Furfurilactobacillus rossiae DSM 15814 TaxID=1114972 RepID=A0A0R1RTN9_9LACO|nr:uracil-DNA glycosylase [Furfurilactobacillus rossiae]KRL56595.1 uracil-DNA glycosylase [Furfurilactobacillus rossiae DSM 15814]MCF6166467.1 uracil-DNA glycosylase [Furfurilactobacillus rossiae]QFR66501.1 uracil-DNA glycosylase [Furfurilactobacillus rossiae]QLE61966.1 Uracil-DNA glycosylase [Furfurilactobacillus rossiae]QLE64691.1 Uracil-DNA glycosylase family [Furfurilactobacillus rossiae]